MIALGIVTLDYMRSDQRSPEKFKNAEQPLTRGRPTADIQSLPALRFELADDADRKQAAFRRAISERSPGQSKTVGAK